MRDGFTVEHLTAGFNSIHVKDWLQRLLAAETQAVKLVKLFNDRGYVAVDDLAIELRSQQAPRVELGLVVAYLSGYLAKTTHESRFEVQAFGKYSSSSDAKAKTTMASLMALLTLVDQQGIRKLPNRVPRRKVEKPEERRAKSKPGKE